ncbi:uncharacterized protein O3C94_010226 [Discoglossus pictus]
MEILCTVESAVSQCVTELVGDTTRDIKNILNLDSLTTSIIKTVPTLLNNVGETLKCALRIDHSRIDALLVSLTDGEKGLLAQILQINCLNILNVHGLLSSLELGKILTPLLASVSGLVSGVLDAVLGILGSLTNVNGLLGSILGAKGLLGGLTGKILGAKGLLGGFTGNIIGAKGLLGGLSGSNGLLGGILGGVF